MIPRLLIKAMLGVALTVLKKLDRFLAFKTSTTTGGALVLALAGDLVTRADSAVVLVLVRSLRRTFDKDGLNVSLIYC